MPKYLKVLTTFSLLFTILVGTVSFSKEPEIRGMKSLDGNTLLIASKDRYDQFEKIFNASLKTPGKNNDSNAVFAISKDADQRLWISTLIKNNDWCGSFGSKINPTCNDESKKDVLFVGHFVTFNDVLKKAFPEITALQRDQITSNVGLCASTLKGKYIPVSSAFINKNHFLKSKQLYAHIGECILSEASFNDPKSKKNLDELKYPSWDIYKEMAINNPIINAGRVKNLMPTTMMLIEGNWKEDGTMDLKWVTPKPRAIPASLIR